MSWAAVGGGREDVKFLSFSPHWCLGLPGYRPVPCWVGEQPSVRRPAVRRPQLSLGERGCWCLRGGTGNAPFSRVGVYLDAFCCGSSSFLFLGRSGTRFIVVDCSAVDAPVFASGRSFSDISRNVRGGMSRSRLLVSCLGSFETQAKR